MEIWLVNPFDPLPGERFRPGRYCFLANLLTNLGYHVVWWTSNWFHFAKEYRKPESSGIKGNLEIRYIPTPPYFSNISFARLYNHYMYAKGFERESANYGSGPSLIIASFPPIESAAAALLVARRFRCKIVVDIQDLWPHVYLLAFPTYLRSVGKVMLNPIFRKTKAIMQGAGALAGVSEDYIQFGLDQSRQDKEHFLLHLGIDLKAFDKCRSSFAPPASKKAGETWAVYVGTMSRTYDLDIVLNAANHFLRNPSVKIFLAGGGPELERLRMRVHRENLTNVHFTGFLQFCELVHLMLACDIGLNTFRRDAPQAFPNKVFDYFAAGLPIVNSIRGELENALVVSEAGITYESENTRDFIDALEYMVNDELQRRQMAHNARKLAESRYDRNVTYPAFVSFLQEQIV